MEILTTVVTIFLTFVPSSLCLESKYYTVIQNLKTNSGVEHVKTVQAMSEIDCARQCLARDSCCAASYHKIPGSDECVLDSVPLCETKFATGNGWLTMTTTETGNGSPTMTTTETGNGWYTMTTTETGNGSPTMTTMEAPVPATSDPTLTPPLTEPLDNPKDCEDITMFQSGVYTIYPTGSHGFSAFCEYNGTNMGGTHLGPWTVIQRRVDNSVNFNESWLGYKDGFGDLYGNFWIGNDNLHLLTSQDPYILEVVMEDWANVTVFARYSTFSVGNESTKYLLNVGGFEGNIGDSFTVHSGQMFSTYDNDNDDLGGTNCAAGNGGGWWYTGCKHSNLNGAYREGGQYPAQTWNVLSWLAFHNLDYSLKSCSMKIVRN